MSTAAIPPTEDPRARAARTKRDRTRRALLDAADSAFGSRGWARTRVEDIAQSAGVSAATAYNHFPTKHALLAQVYAPIISPLLAAGPPGHRGGPAGRGSTVRPGQSAVQAVRPQPHADGSLLRRRLGVHDQGRRRCPTRDDDADPRTLVPMTEALELLIAHGQRIGELRSYPSAGDMSRTAGQHGADPQREPPGRESRDDGRAVTHRDVRRAAAGGPRQAPSGRSGTPLSAIGPSGARSNGPDAIAERSSECCQVGNDWPALTPASSAARAEHVAQRVDDEVQLGVGDHERRRDPDRRPVGVLDEHPAAASASLTARPVPRRGSTSTPAHSPTPRTAHTPCPTRPAEPAVQVRAEVAGTAQEVAVVQEPDHRPADRARQRVAAEGAAVLARPQHAEHVGVRDDGRQRQRSRRRAPCPAGRRRRRRPRPGWRAGARCARAPTAPRRPRTARRCASQISRIPAR